jgi:hypothetical protein
LAALPMGVFFLFKTLTTPETLSPKIFGCLANGSFFLIQNPNNTLNPKIFGCFANGSFFLIQNPNNTQQPQPQDVWLLCQWEFFPLGFG